MRLEQYRQDRERMDGERGEEGRKKGGSAEKGGGGAASQGRMHIVCCSNLDRIQSR